MYPVFDIPLPSPSLKRTQREANFLSGNFFSRTDQSRRTEGNTRRGCVKRDRTRVVAGSVSFFFDEEEKFELRKLAPFCRCVGSRGIMCSDQLGPDDLPNTDWRVSTVLLSASSVFFCLLRTTYSDCICSFTIQLMGCLLNTIICIPSPQLIPNCSA